MKREHEDLPTYTYTYASGPEISSATPVTTKTMVRLIDALKHHFGPGYEFAPEPISEGGIQMTHWPDQTDEPKGTFKTFRFHMLLNKSFHLTCRDSILIDTLCCRIPIEGHTPLGNSPRRHTTDN